MLSILDMTRYKNTYYRYKIFGDDIYFCKRGIIGLNFYEFPKNNTYNIQKRCYSDKLPTKEPGPTRKRSKKSFHTNYIKFGKPPGLDARYYELLQDEQKLEEDKKISTDLQCNISNKDFVNHQGLDVMTNAIRKRFSHNPDQPSDRRYNITAFINLPNNISEQELTESVRKGITVAMNTTFIKYPHDYYNKYIFHINCKLTYDPKNFKFIRRDNKRFILNKINPDVQLGLIELEKIIKSNKAIFNEASIATTPTIEQQVLRKLGDCYDGFLAGKVNFEFSPISLLPSLTQENFPWYEYHIKHTCDLIAQNAVRRPSKSIVSVKVLKKEDIPNNYRPLNNKNEYNRYVYINITRDELLSRFGLTCVHRGNPYYDPDENIVKTT
jgi:hypothetical protein